MTSLDARSVTVPLAALTDHLGCSLCHGMLRDAQTITECLHSFCKSCIYRHFLVQGSKQCPKCLMTLTARPITTLIPDQRLQDVVDRIFPEFKARDAELEQEFYEKHNFKRKETDEATVAASGEKATKSAGAVVSSSIPAPSTVQLYTVEMSPKPVETPLPALERPYLQVDGKLKMFELRKLLQKRLDLDKPEMLELSCLGATVGPELSVHFIHRTIWHPQQQKPTLELHYSLLSA